MQHERRVFAPCIKLNVGSHVTISREDSRHLCKVLRLTEGDEVVVVDRENGAEFVARIISLSPTVTVELFASQTPRQNTSLIELLAVALCKGGVNDSLCERATELGVRNLVFWQAERSIPKISSLESRNKKVERWQRIAESACKQSSRNDLPTIHYAASLDEALSISSACCADTHQLYCCSLSPEAKPVELLNLGGSQAHLLVGPEGDFSDAEEAAIKKVQGVQLLSLGGFRLRVETAVLMAIGTLSGALAMRKTERLFASRPQT